MRKSTFIEATSVLSPAQEGWLDLDSLARVEVTSEHAAFPIESALLPGAGPGWEAAHPGGQVIRLYFDEPQPIRRVQLQFNETKQNRTQEFLLRWSPGGNQPYREIIRQQYCFSPPDTTQESEDYEVELEGVTALELTIVPDQSGGDARATLTRLRLA